MWCAFAQTTNIHTCSHTYLAKGKLDRNNQGVVHNQQHYDDFPPHAPWLVWIQWGFHAVTQRLAHAPVLFAHGVIFMGLVFARKRFEKPVADRCAFVAVLKEVKVAFGCRSLPANALWLVVVWMEARCLSLAVDILWCGGIKDGGHDQVVVFTLVVGLAFTASGATSGGGHDQGKDQGLFPGFPYLVKFHILFSVL
jgi:hypothetical protein